MKVSEMLVKIEYLRGLKEDLDRIASAKDVKSLDVNYVTAMEDAIDVIDEYINELLRKNVTM